MLRIQYLLVIIIKIFLNKDEIHEDLAPQLEDANMEFKRNIGEALNLAPDLNEEVEDYLEYLVENHLEIHFDMLRGK